ncbi:MAG: hypothetical protein JNL85_03470 [Rubrivivax sp.]|nr:hypothetical protein [Rubrivivax sp.]
MAPVHRIDSGEHIDRQRPAGERAVSARSPRRRAAIAAGGVAVVALLVAAAWWGLAPRDAGPARAETPFPWGRAPAGNEPLAQAAAAAPLPGASDAAAAAAFAASAAAPSGPVAFDLCGLGRIVVPGRDTDRESGSLAGLPPPVGRLPLQEALARLAGTLAAGDPKQRVAARMLRQPGDDDPAAQAAWARGLVADALASRDAQALRWAGAACPFVEDEAQCRTRLARARVQAEPANALHWLEWAHEEPAAADAAWAGLQRAQYWREQPLGLAGVLLRAVPTDIAPYLQSALAVEAMAHDVAFPAPPLSPLLERCPARGAAGAPAAACERLARLLLERSDSVQALMLGRELGEHIGWPAEPLTRLEREIDALQRQEAHWTVDEQRPLGCATVESQRSHIAAVEREGELAVLRRNLASLPAPAVAAAPAPAAAQAAAPAAAPR